jgi:bifunctional non-homologous end joining protein LigD
MVAVSAKELPQGGEWLYEPKWDGYRAVVVKNGTVVSVLSRNEKDFTRMYPKIVAVDENGTPAFQALQHRALYPSHEIVFYVFDALHRNGRGLTDQPLVARRAELEKMVQPDLHLRLVRPLPGAADDVVQAILEVGLEGIVAKRKSSIYQPGERSSDWVKLVLEHKQELVIGGYRLADPRSIDSLLVGYYEGKDLRFASKVHGGLTPHLRRSLFDTLRPLEIAKCPFSNLPDAKTSRWGSGVTAEQMKDFHWVRPHIVAQIRFADYRGGSPAPGQIHRAARRQESKGCTPRAVI